MTTAQLPTSEVLHLAADLIEKRGWSQGANGWDGFHLADDAPLCLEGGIMAALGINWGSDDALGDLWSCPAYLAVEKHLDAKRTKNSLGVPMGEVWKFNDEQYMTAERVIEVLRATALIESARESELAKASA